MHGRYRNGPGSGFRSNAMGSGNIGATSRNSPEGSFKGHRMHNFEHRNYNRGGYARGGGGRLKHFQPPPRETNVLVEAGRLAAEYLVSRGVLPPNALSGKLPLDDLRNLLNNFPGSKSREVANSQILGDARGGSRRLGNSGLDQGRETRNNNDENNSTGSANSIRGGKRSRSSDSNGSEVNKLERSVSWAEKGTASPKVEADDDATILNHDKHERQGNEHGNAGIEKSSPGEIMPKVNESHKKYEFEKSDVAEGRDADSSSFANDANNEGEPSIKSVDAADKFRNDDGSEKIDDKTNKVLSSSVDGSSVGEDYVDLAKQCKFTNLPTKTRSSLKNKNSKRHLSSTSGAQNASNGEVSEVPLIHVIDIDTGTSSGNVAPRQNCEREILQPDALKDSKLVVSEGVPLVTRQGYNLRSSSFPERSLLKDKKPDEELARFASFDARTLETGGKRAFGDETDYKEGYKRLKESGGQTRSSSSMDSQLALDETKASSNVHAISSSDHGCLDVSIYPRAQVDSSGFMQEKLLFPGSFKTSDLNLVRTSDLNVNNGAGAKTRAEQKPIDIGFSMTNNVNLPNKLSITGNNIEIIDLENDSAEEDKNFGNPDKRGDNVFTDLDSFPGNVHNANGMPDVVQDGYGFMISELLGNEGPSCSSVPPDLNSLHGHMGLSNPDGILGDDESIYMSLDEIPLSLLGPWEQPSQDYGKPF